MAKSFADSELRFVNIYQLPRAEWRTFKNTVAFAESRDIRKPGNSKLPLSGNPGIASFVSVCIVIYLMV